MKFFRRQGQPTGGMRRPRDMGSREVKAFLTMLATELLARLLYGTSMRLMEGIHLRGNVPIDRLFFSGRRQGATAQITSTDPKKLSESNA